MKPAEAMAARLRPLVGHLPGVVEKKMFGGAGFMLNGNMVVGSTAKGAMLVRIDPERAGEALARPGAYQMHMGPRAMTGFIAINDEDLPDDEALTGWVEYALAFVRTMPPK